MNPDSDTAALRAEANALAARRDWPAAADRFRRLAQRDPADAAALVALARAEALCGHHRASHAAAMAAAAAAPRQWPHALALARLLCRLHAVPALVALADDWLPRAGDAPPADLVDMADLLGHEDAHAEALPWLDLALARDPGFAPAHYVRGSTRLFFGDMDGARDDLERAIALAPHFAHAHWRLSELRPRDETEARARVHRLRAARDGVDPGSEHDIHVSHALFAELHRLGDHDAAWQALERGMRAKRASFAYDVGDDLRLMRDIAIRCDAGFVAGDGHPDGDGGPAPVFIVGMFRSGTTLMERVLGGHPEVAEGGETMGFAAALRRAVDHRGRGVIDQDTLQRLDAVDWPALGAGYLAAESWRAHGRRYWTEKLPSNFQLLGLVARALPRARFVHMRRAPMDVCFANLRMLYGGFCRYSYDQREIAAFHHGYEALMAHWRTVLGPRLLEVSLADLTGAPEREARRVLAHCGLDWDPTVLDIAARAGAVSTASAAQVRDAIRAPAEAAWQPYRQHLQVLSDALDVPPGS